MEEQSIIQMIQSKLGIIASIVGSVVVIVSAVIAFQSSPFALAQKGWVDARLEENNRLRDSTTLRERGIMLEGNIRNWTIQFVDLNESRRAAIEQIADLNTLIQKNINQNMDNTPEHQILVTLLARAQSDYDSIQHQIESNQ